MRVSVSNRKVALGVSGGVDSAVSISVLKNMGYEVIGITCIFDRSEKTDISIRDAKSVCESFGILHVVYDASEDFSRLVLDNFVSSYERGLTPSPCVVCNAGCKFPSLFNAADKYDCDFVATGHYARIGFNDSSKRYCVKEATDKSKDQSYMLSMLTQEQLAKIVFPLGSMIKTQVRCIAKDLGLDVADKPESQDLCFTSSSYIDYLLDSGIKEVPGDIIDMSGKVLGRHQGLFRYTIGQRKGIGIAAAFPYYVVHKNIETNQLVLGFKESAYTSAVLVKDLNWQAVQAPSTSLECEVKLRYRSKKSPATLIPYANGEVEIALHEPELLTSPGQFAVFYEDDKILGSGVIC